MDLLDLAVKTLLREVPGAVLGLALPARPLGRITADDVELGGSARRVDKLLRLEPPGEAPLHVHVEVQAAWRADVPWRVHEYWTLARRALKRARLLSLVLVLKRGARQASPCDGLAVDVLGLDVLRFRFAVVRAWELDVDALLARGEPGQLPLVPFARGASPARVEAAIAALEVAPSPVRADLLGALAAFAGNVFPGVAWRDKIPREVLVKSTFYDQILAEGEAKVLARLLVGRLDGLAAPYVARLAGRSPETLGAVADLLARPRVRTATLVRALERLLPPPTSPKGARPARARRSS